VLSLFEREGYPVKRPVRFFAMLFVVLVLLVVGGHFKMKHDLNRAVGVFANATQHVIGPSAKAAVAPVPLILTRKSPIHG
jgi:hypothetical protein